MLPRETNPPFTGSKSSADCKDVGWRRLLAGGETQESVPTAQLGGETDKPFVLFLLREKLNTSERYVKRPYCSYEAWE